MHTIRCKMNDVMNKAFSSITMNYETHFKAFLTSILVFSDVKTVEFFWVFPLSGMIFTLPFCFYF